MYKLLFVYSMKNYLKIHIHEISGKNYKLVILVLETIKNYRLGTSLNINTRTTDQWSIKLKTRNIED